MARKTPLVSLKQISEINLTPLMDLTFILLITFIITFPLIEQGIDINLPSGRATPLELTDAQTISMDVDGRVYLNDGLVTLEELTASMENLAAVNAGTTVMVRADKALEYGAVVKILKMLHGCSLTRIALVTREEWGQFMDRRFYRILKIVAAVHVVAAAVLIGLSALPGCFVREAEVLVPIEFMVDVTVPAEVAPAAEPPAPIERTPVEPVVPDPAALPVRERPKIERSRVRVRRDVNKSATQPELSKEEIRRRLALDATPGDRNTNIPDEDDRNMLLIHQALHRAWAQPSAEAVGDRTVTAAIRLDANGHLVERKLVRRSGNGMLDASVMQALESVPMIGGLSKGFLKRHQTITVLFEIE